MIALVRARRVLRIIALTTAVLFVNLVMAVQFGPLVGEISAAWAQEGGGRRVAVFVLPETEGDARIAAVLNSIIRGNCRQLSDATLISTSPTEGEVGLVEATRLADAGMEALNRRDYAVAEQSLSRAYALVEQGLAAVPQRLHGRVLKGLGVARFFVGKIGEARELIKKSLLVFERQTAAEYAYSLEAKNLYREVRQELQDLAVGTLQVRSTPPGAAVHVDYHPKGFTLPGEPLVLQNLPAGPHYVRLTLDGYFVWAGYVTVEPAGTATVAAALKVGPEGDRLKALLGDSRQALRSGRGPEHSLRALRQHVGATELLVVLASPSPEGFQLTGFLLPRDNTLVPVDEVVVQDVTLSQNLRDMTALTFGGEYAPQETLALDSPAGGAGEIVLAPAGGSEDLFLDPSLPIFRGTRQEQPTPVYKKWWFWTILGVAVGGLTAGIVLVSTSRSGGGGGPTGGVTINLNSF